MSDHALITGASRGIGAAFAERLAMRGRPLILVARDRQRLDALATDLTARHAVPIHVLALDLAEPGAARSLHRVCTEHRWRITTLVNNAGIGRFGRFLDHPIDDYVAMLHLNIMAPLELCHLFLGDMRTIGHGEIVNIASIAALQPTPYLAAYGATKAFVLSFSEALAAEYSAASVRILAVCAGATRTEFFEAAGIRDLRRIESFPMQSADEVAVAALSALERGATFAIPGWRNRVLATVSRLVPHRLRLMLTARALRHQFAIDDMAE